MKGFYSVFTFILISFATIAQPRAKDSTLVIQTPEEFYYFNPLASLLKDAGGKLKVEEVMRMDSLFKPLNGELYHFHQDDDIKAYWVHCSVQNNNTTDLRYVFYFHPGFDTAEFFVFNPDHSSSHLPIVWSQPAKTRPVHISQELVFPVVFHPGVTQLYFRISNYSVYSRELNSIIINLAEEKGFLNHFLKVRHYQGVALGMLGVMLVFHIFIYFFFRDKTYLFFVLNIFITLIYLLLRKSYQEEIDWMTPFLTVLRYLHDPAASLLCLTALLFSQSFLNTSKEDPLMHRWMNYLAYALTAVTLCLVFLQFLYWMDLATIYLGFVTAAMVIIASLRSYFRGNNLALYAFFGFAMLLFVPLLYIIPLPGYNSFRNSESDFHYFGEAIRSLIFAVGIADRFYGIKKEAVRKELQQKNLEFEKERQMQEEKERISRDLHDNIGTQLTSLTQGLNRLSKSGSHQPEKLRELYEHANAAILELRETIWVINKMEVTLEEFADKINNLFWRLRQQDGEMVYELKMENISSGQMIQPGQAINLFRIIQESINNSIKHSKANVITVWLVRKDFIVSLSIRDNGIGFNADQQVMNEHYGLSNMTKRAEDIHSQLKIISEPGKGTSIEIDFACKEPIVSKP